MVRVLFVAGLITLSSLFAAAATRLDSVVRKMSTDERAYQQFLALGEAYFLQEEVGNNDLFSQLHGSLYNAFDPFARLVSADSLQSLYAYLRKKYLPATTCRKESTQCSHYYRAFRDCHTWWNAPKNKGIYLKFIKKKGNYNLVHENFDPYCLQYLSGYFISVESH